MQVYLIKNNFLSRNSKKKGREKEESSKYNTENAVKKRRKIQLGK